MTAGPLTRRGTLQGAAAAALGLGASACSPGPARAAALSPADARLVAIAAELEAVDRRMTALADADPEAESLPEWRALLVRFEPLESELETLPADTMAGVLAKARGSQVGPVQHCANGIGDSIAADLVRLQARGLV